MAEKYCDGRIEIVPAMRKPGRGVNGGAILEAELDAIKPDFVLSLDTYARLTPGVCEKHTVVGIHPGNLRESPNLHSVLRTLIANSQNNNRSQTITGTVHLVSGNVVDGGTPVAEVVVPYNRSAGAYQVRQNVYDALANLMLDEIVSKLIAEGRDGFIREKFVQEGELLPPLTQEDVMRHFVHGERPLFRYKEVLETIAGFLPDREAMLSADFPKIPLIEKHEVKKFARPTAPLYRVADTEGLQVA